MPQTGCSWSSPSRTATADYARFLDAGVEVVTPLATEPWGERYFQMADPNGVIFQLVQWVTPPDPQYAC